MKALFVELPAFSRHRSDYLDDDGYRALQEALIEDPEAGHVLRGAGGLRKLRFADPRRGKGKRGGLRIVYFWWSQGRQFWLFTVFDKNEMADLTPREREQVRQWLRHELEERSRR